jgi:Putative transposase
LFPQKAMQKIYKAYFLKQLRQLIVGKVLQVEDAAAVEQCIEQAGYKPWNVYAKKPFGGPLQVLNYLGRYTHKVAITANRIEAIDEVQQTIRFKYKDYHARGTKKEQQVMVLKIPEFIRRYEQHNLSRTAGRDTAQGFCKDQALWVLKKL